MFPCTSLGFLSGQGERGQKKKKVPQPLKEIIFYAVFLCCSLFSFPSHLHSSTRHFSPCSPPLTKRSSPHSTPGAYQGDLCRLLVLQAILRKNCFLSFVESHIIKFPLLPSEAFPFMSCVLLSWCHQKVIASRNMTRSG